MQSLPLILTPLIAALIGWFTNFVAIKMLFRPARPVRILGIKFHGLVPKRQKELAVSIAETVESELISHRDVRDFLNKPESHQHIEALLTEHVNIFLTEKLGAMPMIAMFLHGEMAQTVREMLLTQLRSALPQLVESMVDRIETGLDFREVIRQKIEAFELSKLEEIIYRISARELRTIELLGGVLGFMVGLGQVCLFLVMK